MRILLFIIFLCLATPSVQIFACTGFFATQGETAPVGNNEDFFDTTQTKILVKPAEGNKYGRLSLDSLLLPHIIGLENLTHKAV